MRTLTILVAAIFLLAAASCGGGEDETPSVNFPEQVPRSVQDLETDDGAQIKKLILSVSSRLNSSDLIGYYELHSSAFRSTCPFDEFSAGLGQFSGLGSPNQEIYFHSVEIEGDSALVYYDLGGNRSSQELVRENGRWWLVPATNCQGRLSLFGPEPTATVGPNPWDEITIDGFDLSQARISTKGTGIEIPFSITNVGEQTHLVEVKADYTWNAQFGERRLDQLCDLSSGGTGYAAQVPPSQNQLVCNLAKTVPDIASITTLRLHIIKIDGSADPALTSK